MCGRFKDTRTWADYREQLVAASLPIVLPEAAPNLEVREEIRPTDPAVIFRPAEGGVELLRARWWFVPWFHRGALKDWKLTTFNAKAETVATSRTFRDSFRRRRCLVPADGWWEWVAGPKGSKVRHWIEPKDGEPIMLVGLWDRCDTTDEGAEVLFREDWRRWLGLGADVSEPLGPESCDRFRVEPWEGWPGV